MSHKATIKATIGDFMAIFSEGGAGKDETYCFKIVDPGRLEDEFGAEAGDFISICPGEGSYYLDSNWADSDLHFISEDDEDVEIEPSGELEAFLNSMGAIVRLFRVDIGGEE